MAARAAGANVVEGGTYLAMEGPQFSTRAESELYRAWGCHVIGMTNMPEAKLAREAERLGYDSVWTAEAWGSDAFTPLTWIAAHTSRIRLGTGIAQMAARTPTATADE